MSFRFARWALPLIALVAIVGTACTPVKQQFGKNILATTITNGCLPSLGDGQNASSSQRSPSNNFSREVCSGGAAGHSVGANGVTLQWVNVTGDPTVATGSGAGFVTGGLNQLGAIDSIKVTATGGSAPINVTIVLDKNKDGQFLCPAGSAEALCGDAVAVFVAQASAANGHEFVYNNQDALNIVFFEPSTGAPFFFAKGGTAIGQPVNLAQLKQGQLAGIDGFTPAVLSFSAGGSTAATQPDGKATVTGVEVNGAQYLP